LIFLLRIRAAQKRAAVGASGKRLLVWAFRAEFAVHDIGKDIKYLSFSVFLCSPLSHMDID
jgi:hypothetical protein